MKRISFLIVALISFFAVSSMSLYAENSCEATHERMSEWAKMNPAPSLAQVRELSAPEQRAAVNYLRPEVLASLWNEKLDEVLRTFPMTPEQTDLIQQVKPLIVPAFFENSSDGDLLRQAALPLQSQIEEMFSKRDVRLIFAQLGPNSGDLSINFGNGNGQSTSFPSDSINPSGILSVSQQVDCFCNLADDWCMGELTCRDRGCDVKSWGCGWWMAKPCNGVCVHEFGITYAWTRIEGAIRSTLVGS